ncbi:retrovirus-related Pol polyprotein from transposon 412 [Trichonephila clavipes]|nr:retrovirus-related Pol polyprotein from transposon 412 [Trichonephila clavipes]
MLDLRSREGHPAEKLPRALGAEIHRSASPVGGVGKPINGNIPWAEVAIDFRKAPLSRRVVTSTEYLKMLNCPEQKSSAEKTVQEFEDVFSRNSSDIGHTTVTQHRIDTADHPPIKQHPRRLPFAKQEEVGTLLREMQGK